MTTNDAALAEQGTAIRIRVLNTDNEDAQPPFTLSIAGQDIRPGAQPITVSLVPDGKSAGRRYTVIADLLADEEVLATQSVSGAYRQGAVREVWVSFDASCEEACPSGYRCEVGRCVEHCVAPSEPGTITRSAPVPCGDPCSADSCRPGAGDDEDLALGCDMNGGYQVFRGECLFGCDNSEGRSRCKQLVPSNIGEVTMPDGLKDVVIDGVFLNSKTIFDTTTGSVLKASGSICDPCVADPLDPLNAGIHFEIINQGAGTDCPMQETEARELGVFYVDSLTIEEGATLVGTGSRALVLVARRDVRIGGAIEVSATDAAPGPGGCAGGLASNDANERRGQGLGGAEGAKDAGAGGWSGAGGGSFGGFGGAGGSNTGGLTGGAEGATYATGTRLAPLLGGSGGGAGVAGSGAEGGHGGGAIQISTSGRVMILPVDQPPPFGFDGYIVAGGGGGGGALSGPGGGGGSGGAILIESAELQCFEDPMSGLPAPWLHLAAPGGGGGGAGESGEVGRIGDTRLYGFGPQGGDGGGGAPPGGHGSGARGEAATGQAGDFASGGGGGWGRVHINTRGGNEVQCGNLLTHPVSFGTALAD